jgi:hypothetical protein
MWMRLGDPGVSRKERVRGRNPRLTLSFSGAQTRVRALAGRNFPMALRRPLFPMRPFTSICRGRYCRCQDNGKRSFSNQAPSVCLHLGMCKGGVDEAAEPHLLDL